MLQVFQYHMVQVTQSGARSRQLVLSGQSAPYSFCVQSSIGQQLDLSLNASRGHDQLRDSWSGTTQVTWSDRAFNRADTHH